MRKIIMLVTALLILAGTGYAGQLNKELTNDGLTAKVSIDNDPLKVGENNMSIELADENGKNITGAEISVYYFMPIMPAMNYEAIAAIEDDNYTAVIKPTMPGKWKGAIKVKNGAEKVQEIIINFEAK